MERIDPRAVLCLFSDLSECELVHVPDAVYMLMRNTTLEVCNLSANVLRRIPAKLAIKFPTLTGSKSFVYIKSSSPSKMLQSTVQPLNGKGTQVYSALF